MLVPLFGIQLLFIIYRPPPHWPGATEFQIVSDVVTNLQVTCIHIYQGQGSQVFSLAHTYSIFL